MKLEISSGLHAFTDAEERSDAVGAVDAVFKEGRPALPPARDRLLNWLSAPLLLGAMTTWTTLLRGVSVVAGSDLAVVDTVAKREQVPVHVVDKSAHGIVYDRRPLWALANWLLLIQPVPFLLDGAVVDASRLLVGVVAALFVAFLAGTMVERNVHMVLEIARLAEEHGYERGVLVTGGLHHGGVVALARRIEGIELVEGATE